MPAVIGVPDLVVARHHAVVKAAKRARRSGLATDFHRLRIRGKRLRYSLEFSAELYGGRTDRYTKKLSKLQDELGRMQDGEVAAARLAALATSEAHLSAATVFVMGAVAQHHRRQVERLLRRLPAELNRVGGKAWQEMAALMDRTRTEAVAAQPPMRRVLRSVPPPAIEPPGPAPVGADEPAPVPLAPPHLA
jgi:hypothetical protein